MKAPIFETLGCRLNAYESEAMKRLAEEAGLEDAIVVNTCAVTSEAVRSSKQRIRKLRRDHPDARLIVTGCAAQIDPSSFAQMDEVDNVVGNAEKMSPDIWQGFGANDIPRVIVDHIMSVRETASHLIDGFGTRARAYVQVPLNLEFHHSNGAPFKVWE